MRAGDLNTRITIESFTPGDGWSDPGGWAEYATLWANVRHLRGSEAIRSDKETTEVQASIRVRWRSDLDAGMRCLVGGKAYSITAVLPDLVDRQHVDLVAEMVE